MTTRTLLHASVLGLLLVTAPGVDKARGAAVTDVGGSFLGLDGAPLPFQNEDDVLEYLRTALVIDEKPIGRGVNGSRKVLLDRNGVRAYAAFRDVDRTKHNKFLEGRLYPVFRDSYLFEPAAYELAKLLGIHNVPPAVLRRVGRRNGSLQLWVENIRDEEEGFRPPSVFAWIRQIRDMALFDNLIFNIDRNKGNRLITQDYTLMMIDHTRGFQRRAGLLNPERVTQVNRQTWERLRSLTDEDLSDTVRPFLSPAEISMLLLRRQRLLDHFQELIATRGEDVVVMN